MSTRELLILGVFGLLLCVLVLVLRRKNKSSQHTRTLVEARAPNKIAVAGVEYTLGLAGESFRNEDGTERQSIIRRCKVGESLKLFRDHDNPHDPNAVAVLRETGDQLGFIKKKDAGWVAKLIDEGHAVEAEIESIMGGSSDKPSLGVTINLFVERGSESASSQDRGAPSSS